MYEYLNEKLTEGANLLDVFQREVCIKKENAVVAAGAGSGKTETLATRFAHLIMSDENLHVENILALTFTKKAASEIYARVHSKLAEFAERLPEEKYPKERELCARALREFADAKISTLDSYSGNILRLAANIYGIRPDFSVGETESSASDLALPFVLKYRNEDCFNDFATDGAIEEFAETYFAKPILEYTSLATDSGYFSKKFQKQIEECVAAWNTIFAGDGKEKSKVENLFSVIPGLYSSAEEMVWKKGQMFVDSDYGKAVKAVVELLNDTEFPLFMVSVEEILDGSARQKISDGLKILSSLNIDAKAYSKIPDTKSVCKQISEVLKVFEPLGKKLLAIASYMLKVKSYQRLFQLLDEFLEQVNEQKRSSGALSFRDVTDMALKVLVEQPDIRRQQKRLVKKIMIDEFQDNNGNNRNLLFLLAEKDEKEVLSDGKTDEQFYSELEKNISGDKLFFVGDEKQSIYKFRGAEVSVFNKLESDLQKVGELNGSSAKVRLDMTNNYRSDKELLESFNILFGNNEKSPDQTRIPSLFYKDRGTAEFYEAQYKSNATHMNELPSSGLTADNVRIHACLLNVDAEFGKKKDLPNISDEKCLDEKDTHGYFIARKISEIISAETEEYNKKVEAAGDDVNAIRKLHKPCWSDFAVLERSRSKRDSLCAMLSLFKIPYVVDSQTKIFREGIVNDIYSFLRLCVYPSDSLSYAAFLGSPYAGLSTSAVENVLAVQVPSMNSGLAFRAFEFPANQFSEKELDLDETDMKKYSAAKTFFEEHRMRVLSQPVTKTLEELWYDCGYFYETQAKKELGVFAEHFDLMYELARNCENSGNSVAWFVDELGKVKKKEGSAFGDDESDIDVSGVKYPLEKGDAVSILTIHQSKGLEYEHVFVTGLYPKKSEVEKDETVFHDDEFGVSFKTNDKASNYFFLRLKDETLLKDDAELKRVAYVAITRARKDVYIVGSVSTSETLEKRANDSSVSADDNRTDSVMHKITRFYFGDEIYAPNDFTLDKGNFTVPYCESGIWKAGSPMDFIRINVVQAKSVDRHGDQSSVMDARKNAAGFLEKFYNGPAIEEKDEWPREKSERTASPSSLEEFRPGEKIGFDSSLFVHNSEYSGLNSLLASLAGKSEDREKESSDSAVSQGFSFGNFGTMAHSYLEHFVNTGNVEFVEDSPAFDRTVAKLLNEGMASACHSELSKICCTMTENFSKSTLGLALKSARESGRLVRAENKFKMNMNGTIVTGSIDLVFEDADGNMVIVDYKTNDSVVPEEFIYQQACYRLAVTQLYGVPMERTKTFLYFLRCDRELDITAFTGKDGAELASLGSQ